MYRHPETTKTIKAKYSWDYN